MDRLTVPDERVDGGLRRAIIDAREVRKEAMTIYWRLKKYEDTGLAPEEIMEGKLLTGWVPVEERLPEKKARILVTIKHHKWIADYDSDWVAESEKTVHSEYIEVCEAICFGDIGWEYRDMTGETAFSEDYAFVNPEIDLSCPVVEVVAWMPLPEPYRPEPEKRYR